MKKAVLVLLNLIFLLNFLLPNRSFAVGNTSVITLEFPAGAENTGLGECGVSIANSIYSVFWNPANIPSIGKHTQTQLLYSGFHEYLLPVFDIPDLYHTFHTAGIFANGFLPYIDVGYVFFRNYLNFGENYEYDAQGNVIDTFYSYEVAYANALGVMFLDIFSFGFTQKYFYSALAPGIGEGDEGTCDGVVFDIGFRLQKEFDFLSIFSITPAGGLSILNFGQDSVSYLKDSPGDPLPKKLWYGFSINANFIDLFSYTYMVEKEKCVIDTEYIYHEGHRFQITPFFSYQIGYMNDTAGHREELSRGFTLSFNYLNTIKTLKKVTTIFHGLDDIMIKDINAKIPSNKIQFNFLIEYSRSEIFSIDSPAREGQTRRDVTVGFNIFAPIRDNSIKALIKKKKGIKRKEIIIKEEDRDFVE